MKSDIDELLNHLLASWHQWSRGYTYGRGYPKVDSTCRDARISRQYDDTNGSHDARVDNLIMEGFDAVMNRIQQPHYTALSMQARNLSSRVEVWLSPRLPQDPQERAILLLEGRNMLLRELNKDGVLN